MLLLGPIPNAVRILVQRLVADSGERHGFLLTGGPGGCSYLDADGRVLNWSAWDETVEPVPDGPLKVGLIAIAAERVPGLAAWLPGRPNNALDCWQCCGSGWLRPLQPHMQCPECYGLGWVQSLEIQEVRCYKCGASWLGPVEFDPAIAREVASLIRNGSTITGIRKLRDVTGLGLRDAKGIVQHMTRATGRCQQCDMILNSGGVIVCRGCGSLNYDW